MGAFVDPANSSSLSTTDHENLVLNFESMIGRKLDVEMWYYHWGADFWNGAPKWDLVNGRTPMVKYGAGTVPTLDSIISGSQDATIRALADGAKSLGADFFFCPFWEMNGDWESWAGANNNDVGTFDGPLKYIKAWRHMHDIFVNEGATNAVWVWAPDRGDNPKVTWNHWVKYYPGDAYVDWVGFDGYNWGATQTWSRWTSWEDTFEAAYRDFSGRKPMMIAETASAEIGGDKAQWMADAQAAIKARWPNLAALVWFDDNKETDWRVDSSPAALAAYEAWASDPYFNTRGSQQLPSSIALPAVSGRPQQGVTLSGTNATWSNSPTSFSYQWKRCNVDGGGCAAIAGATALTYQPVLADVGNTLRLFVTAQNAAGTAATASDPTGPVAASTPSAPAIVRAPLLFGTSEQGQTLTGTTGFWAGAPTSFAYQWKRCDASGSNCVDIAGATSPSYTPTASDVGVKVRLRVAATNGAGTGTTTVASWVVAGPPLSTSILPWISGVAVVGATLSGSAGAWSGAPTSSLYHWQRCDSSGATCVDIGSATGSSYTVGSPDVGSTIRFEVTASDAYGSTMASAVPTKIVTTSSTPAETTTASTTTTQTTTPAPVAPTNLAPPTISGAARIGSTLSASAGSWSGTEPITYAYTWRRCARSRCTPVAGATANTYTVTAADKGYALSVSVAASNAAGVATAVSAQTSKVRR
jgi:endoglucanase